jgi:transcriptional regulator with XRE-family HTH domain
MAQNFTVDYVALGAKIRQERENMKMSQEAISEKVGLSESFYGHIERGDRTLSVDSLVKIARYLNLSLDYLLMDSIDSDDNSKLYSEIENIFKSKTTEESTYLLNLLKVLSSNMEKIKP